MKAQEVLEAAITARDPDDRISALFEEYCQVIVDYSHAATTIKKVVVPGLHTCADLQAGLFAGIVCLCLAEAEPKAKASAAGKAKVRINRSKK